MESDKFTKSIMGRGYKADGLIKKVTSSLIIGTRL